MEIFSLYCLLLTILLEETHSQTIQLQGYDCSMKVEEVKVIDAYEVQDCEPPQNQTVKDVKIQLVQKVDSIQRTVHICEVEKFRYVYYCGAYTHMSGAKFPQWGKFEITPIECQIMHERRTFVVDGTERYVKHLKDDYSTFFVDIRGHIDAQSNCNDPGTIFIKEHPHGGLVGRDHYTVTLTTIQTRFINNETILPQNVKVTGVFGYSPLVGTWYTKDPPIVACMDTYQEAYSGQAVAVGEHIGTKSVILIDNNNMVGSVELQEESHICAQYKGFKTVHDGLFVIIVEDYGDKGPFKKIESINLKLNTELSMWGSYLRNDIRTDMKTMAQNLAHEDCKLHRTQLLNALSKLRRDQTHTRDLGFNDGHIATFDGAQIFIAKCKDVSKDIKFRASNFCFEEIPIYYNDEPFFYLPDTKTVTKENVEIDCVEGKVFRIGPKLYKAPDFQEITVPQKLKPRSQATNSSFFSVSYKDIKPINDLNKLVPAVLSNWERLTYQYPKRFANAMYYERTHPDSKAAKHYEEGFLAIFSNSFKTMGDWILKNLNILLIILLSMGSGIAIFAVLFGCCSVGAQLGCTKEFLHAMWLIMKNLCLLFYYYFQFFLRTATHNIIQVHRDQPQLGHTNRAFQNMEEGQGDLM